MGRFSRLERGKKESEKIDLELEKKETERYDQPYFIQQADDLYFTGRFEKALRFYSRALKLDNSQRYPWIGQILCLLELKQNKEAELWSQRGLDLFPEDTSLISLQAISYAHRGMVKRALSCSDYALNKGSTEFTWIARGEALLLAGNKNSSFCFEKALEMSAKDDWKTPVRIGMVYFRHKIYPRAITMLRAAVEINVNNYFIWYLLGKSYQQAGFNTKAIESFERSVEFAPEFRPAKEALKKALNRSIFKRLFSTLFGRKKTGYILISLRNSWTSAMLTI